MVAVYSSALIFDLWYKITNCKDSPALLYLFNGEKEERVREPTGMSRSEALQLVISADQKNLNMYSGNSLWPNHIHRQGTFVLSIFYTSFF